ncbi:hypothetical protein ACF08N_16825 [Streptomyces sp. NPDC015127]|uniref:hypothetical protein n=1 Tax=Streptomyces sp. NPDC015127 TaxID=3364939 RepID=UPI0036F7F8F9
MKSVAVAGASPAGLWAARALRAQGYDGRLVVGEETHRLRPALVVGGVPRRSGEGVRCVRIQFAGYAAGADSVSIEEGAADEGSLLALYRRAGRPVAVRGTNRTRPSMRPGRRLATAAARKAGSP